MPSWTKVDAEVALELLTHEAIVRQTYKDSVGVLTWNVGMTNATGHKVERYINNPADLQHCMNLYVWALERYAKRVRKVFANYDLKKHEFAAALSFDWNTGRIHDATWPKLVKKGKMEAARNSFDDWNIPPEIMDRREKEIDLFFDGVWSQTGFVTEYTKVTSKLTPVWSSAKKIDVRKELAKAFEDKKIVPIDIAPKPENIPIAPTVTPSAVRAPSLWELVQLFFYELFARLKGK